eukprot:Nk52_evm35s2391 gene=Nk52_evmTU35s2391
MTSGTEKQCLDDNQNQMEGPQQKRRLDDYSHLALQELADRSAEIQNQSESYSLTNSVNHDSGEINSSNCNSESHYDYKNSYYQGRGGNKRPGEGNHGGDVKEEGDGMEMEHERKVGKEGPNGRGNNNSSVGIGGSSHSSRSCLDQRAVMVDSVASTVANSPSSGATAVLSRNIASGADRNNGKFVGEEARRGGNSEPSSLRNAGKNERSHSSLSHRPHLQYHYRDRGVEVEEERYRNDERRFEHDHMTPTGRLTPSQSSVSVSSARLRCEQHHEEHPDRYVGSRSQDIVDEEYRPPRRRRFSSNPRHYYSREEERRRQMGPTDAVDDGRLGRNPSFDSWGYAHDGMEHENSLPPPMQHVMSEHHRDNHQYQEQRRFYEYRRSPASHASIGGFDGRPAGGRDGALQPDGMYHQVSRRGRDLTNDPLNDDYHGYSNRYVANLERRVETLEDVVTKYRRNEMGLRKEMIRDMKLLHLDVGELMGRILELESRQSPYMREQGEPPMTVRGEDKQVGEMYHIENINHSEQRSGNVMLGPLSNEKVRAGLQAVTSRDTKDGRNASTPLPLEGCKRLQRLHSKSSTGGNDISYEGEDQAELYMQLDEEDEPYTPSGLTCNAKESVNDTIVNQEPSHSDVEVTAQSAPSHVNESLEKLKGPVTTQINVNGNDRVVVHNDHCKTADQSFDKLVEKLKKDGPRKMLGRRTKRKAGGENASTKPLPKVPDFVAKANEENSGLGSDVEHARSKTLPKVPDFVTKANEENSGLDSDVEHSVVDVVGEGKSPKRIRLGKNRKALSDDEKENSSIVTNRKVRSNRLRKNTSPNETGLGDNVATDGELEDEESRGALQKRKVIGDKIYGHRDSRGRWAKIQPDISTEDLSSRPSLDGDTYLKGLKRVDKYKKKYFISKSRSLSSAASSSSALLTDGRANGTDAEDIEQKFADLEREIGVDSQYTAYENRVFNDYVRKMEELDTDTLAETAKDSVEKTNHSCVKMVSPYDQFLILYWAISSGRVEALEHEPIKRELKKNVPRILEISKLLKSHPKYLPCRKKVWALVFYYERCSMSPKLQNRIWKHYMFHVLRPSHNAEDYLLANFPEHLESIRSNMMLYFVEFMKPVTEEQVGFFDRLVPRWLAMRDPKRKARRANYV